MSFIHRHRKCLFMNIMIQHLIQMVIFERCTAT